MFAFNFSKSTKISALLVGMLFAGASAIAAPTTITGTYSTGDGSDGNMAAPLGSTPPYTLTATNATFSYVVFTPDQAFTFSQLTKLNAMFQSISGGSGVGTPRLVVDLDTDHDTVIDHGLLIYLGTSPGFQDSDAVLNTYSGFNVIGNNDSGRYDTSHFAGGSSTTTYASALGLLGGADVLGFEFQMDTFSPYPDRNLTLDSINAEADISAAAVPEPGTIALLALGLTGLALRRRKE